MFSYNKQAYVCGKQGNSPEIISQVSFFSKAFFSIGFKLDKLDKMAGH